MNIDKISIGKNIPEEFNVIIEIPAHSHPVKYEMDKESGALFLDRFIGTGMTYPCNYGFIPHTLSEDGDPADVLVITPFPLVHGSVVACRALGVLHMEDESGVDAKIIAVPTKKLCQMYANVESMDQLPELLLSQIKYFFEHYKDLEPGKWVKIKGFADAQSAKNEITNAINHYAKNER